MRRGWTSLCIGWICALAQTAPGQVAEDLFTLESGRAGWLRELDAGLRLEPGRWPDVWRRAGDLGPVAAPVLWGKLRRDRRTRGRLLWITTYVAATGHGGQLVSGEWILEARKPERVMALIAAALAEGGVVEPAELRRLVRDTSSPALRVAGCLALSRATGATALPGDWFVASGGPDPGACAAALMCGAEPPSQLLERWLASRRAPDATAQLVWRAMMLSAHPTPYAGAMRRQLAVRALQWQGPAVAATRRAAMLQVSRSDDPGALLVDVPVPLSSDLVLLLGRTAAGREVISRRRWVSAVPSQRLDQDLRRQLAVQFAAYADPVEVERAARSWAGDQAIAPAVCLALAWRAWARGDLVDGPWLDQLEEIDECWWSRLAVGRAVDPERLPEGAPTLRRAAAVGRAPADVLAREMERELWRRRSHPGVHVFGCWTELVRDLLLSGSGYARAQDTRREQFPYLPGDLQRDDRAFFEVACEYFTWAVADRRAVPEMVRLDPGR